MIFYIQMLLLCMLLNLPLAAQQSRGLLQVRLPSGKEVALYQGSYAVVVGVSNYDYWPDLPNAVRDAEEIGAVLSELGFEVLVVRDPDQQALEGALKDLEFRKEVEQARVLFYFAGHGETETLANSEELGYIVPRDAPLQSVHPRLFVEKAVSMQRIEQCAKRMRFKHALFVFDSCFSGSIFALQRAAPQNISEKCALPVRQFITAGGRDEPVPDQSVFKVSLLRALGGEGDVTGDGYLTGTELGLYLQEKVVDYSRGTQHPQAGTLRDPELDQGDFVLTLKGAGDKPPPPPPAVQVGYLQVNVDVPGSKVYVNGIYQGEANPRQPLNLSDLRVETVEVRVEATGYKTKTERAVLRADAWTQVVMKLEAIPPPMPQAEKLPTPQPALRPSSDTREGDMVLVPAGEFMMGSNEGDSNKKPARAVYLNVYYIDKYEVTVEQYRACVEADVCRKPVTGGLCNWGKFDREDHPINCVTWNLAKGYCTWVGKRLPTEAEWEKAARGTDGRTYPWGEGKDESKANYSGDETRPTGSYPAGVSPYGVHDMAGNVWEWVADWFDEGYYSRSPSRNPRGPETGEYRTVRGGSWRDHAYFVQASDRYYYSPTITDSNVGFRCAQGHK
ncbi:MAG: SUMF1/EgtB/PvdO family nonheme iron enzyme [Chloroflexi bacterium]|nr:SUMF1/EgtB/PvdO family nonheme iron enzyme [Chloroflexota bacterium]